MHVLCSLYGHTWTYVCTMYIYNSLHAGAHWVSRTDRVCVLQVDVCIHVSTCMYCPVCMHTHGRMHVQCTLYILYMQVLNGCLAVTEFVSCRLTSVYMYLHACTVQFVCTHICMYNVHYTFFTCRCSMSVSQLVTNIVGVLRRLYTSTCIYSCVLGSCMHTHGVQCTYTLFTCRCSMDVSQLVTDRIGVLQRLYTSTCIYRCVLCSCMHTHDSTFVLQVLER